MSKLAEVLNREFSNARSKNAEIGTMAQDEAKFLELTSPYLSRLKNDRVPLTQQVIDKIVLAFKNYTDEENLRNELTLFLKQSPTNQPSLIQNSPIEKYSIKLAEELFDKELAKPKSLLCIDYRDLPQAGEDGAYPELAKNAGRAIREGLCFALFQPFGSVESLKAMIKRINMGEDNPKQRVVRQSYDYLLELAEEVRKVYGRMKEKSEADGECKGQIVLYEAVINEPSITAIGLQSRLFLTDYSDENNERQDRIFEWVAAINKEHYFIERTQLSLNLKALRLQFHPIHEFWEESGRLKLPQDKELTKAYKDYKVEELLGKGMVKWKDW